MDKTTGKSLKFEVHKDY